MLPKKDENFIVEKFKNFDVCDEDIKNLTRCAILQKFISGQTLYKTDHECRGFVLVKSGRVRAFVTAPNGKEITIFNLTGGDECIICASCLSENLDINLEVKEETEILIIPAAIFQTLRGKYPKLSAYVLNLLSRRFSESVNVMQSALFTPLIMRIKEYLITHAKRAVVETTHEEIASEIGSSREAISRVLRDMENDKIIQTMRGKIKILKIDAF